MTPEVLVHNPLDPNLMLATLIYTLVGVIVFCAAFWLMVKLAPFSIHKEIEEDQNVAVGVIMGSVIIGLALIISATVGG